MESQRRRRKWRGEAEESEAEEEGKAMLPTSLTVCGIMLRINITL